MSPLSLELYARDLMDQRLAEAQHYALLAQLPHGPAWYVELLPVAARWLAAGLRNLACRLDPCVRVDATVAIARSR